MTAKTQKWIESAKKAGNAKVEIEESQFSTDITISVESQFQHLTIQIFETPALSWRKAGTRVSGFCYNRGMYSSGEVIHAKKQWDLRYWLGRIAEQNLTGKIA